MRVYCVETNICDPYVQYFRSHVEARKRAVQRIRDFVQEERKYNKSFRLAEVAYDLSIQIKACTPRYCSPELRKGELFPCCIGGFTVRVCSLFDRLPTY